MKMKIAIGKASIQSPFLEGELENVEVELEDISPEDAVSFLKELKNAQKEEEEESVPNFLEDLLKDSPFAGAFGKMPPNFMSSSSPIFKAILPVGKDGIEDLFKHFSPNPGPQQGHPGHPWDSEFMKRKKDKE